MNNSKYRGVVVPMVTPVTQDGQLDTVAVERIIDFFAQNKVSPLLMGTTGEGNSVSQADGQLFVETAVKAAQGRILIDTRTNVRLLQDTGRLHYWPADAL